MLNILTFLIIYIISAIKYLSAGSWEKSCLKKVF